MLGLKIFARNQTFRHNFYHPGRIHLQNGSTKIAGLTFFTGLRRVAAAQALDAPPSLPPSGIIVQ